MLARPELRAYLGWYGYKGTPLSKWNLPPVTTVHKLPAVTRQ
jgi:hypothetical protein